MNQSKQSTNWLYIGAGLGALGAAGLGIYYLLAEKDKYSDDQIIMVMKEQLKEMFLSLNYISLAVQSALERIPNLGDNAGIDMSTLRGLIISQMMESPEIKKMMTDPIIRTVLKHGLEYEEFVKRSKESKSNQIKILNKELNQMIVLALEGRKPIRLGLSEFKKSISIFTSETIINALRYATLRWSLNTLRLSKSYLERNKLFILDEISEATVLNPDFLKQFSQLDIQTYVMEFFKIEGIDSDLLDYHILEYYYIGKEYYLDTDPTFKKYFDVLIPIYKLVSMTFSSSDTTVNLHSRTIAQLEKDFSSLDSLKTTFIRLENERLKMKLDNSQKQQEESNAPHTLEPIEPSTDELDLPDNQPEEILEAK